MIFKFLALLLIPSSFAVAKKPKAEEKILQPILIFGTSNDQVYRGFTPKSVGKEKLEIYQYTDVNRALKQTSGVYIREEEGEGLRPNIGLRGTNPDRSKKIVILEDNVLIGPAPYSAPAAYYTPHLNHTEQLDVYKGFAATHIGPNSIGGAINYISSAINEKENVNEAKMSFGSFNTLNSKVKSTGPLSFGSYLIEGSYFYTNGFKEIDRGENPSVSKPEVLGKLKWDISKGKNAQSLELRTGFSTEDSNETYLGLSVEDFNNNPYRRYSASALDEMVWNHQSYRAKHTYQVSELGLLETTLYRNDFHRDWNRLDRFRDTSNGSLNEILQNPNASGARGLLYDILRGNSDSTSFGGNGGDLVIFSNDRTFYSQGLQTEYTDEFNVNLKNTPVNIEPQVLLRLHQDQIIRDQTFKTYSMISGELNDTGEAASTETLNQETSTAFSLSSKTNISFDSLVFTPTFRFELVNFEFKNELDSSKNTDRNDSVFVPGLSVLKRMTPDFSVGLSYNRAATISGLSSSGDEVKELANNYEVLAKYFNQDIMLKAESTVFLTQYENITGTCTVSGGCTLGSDEAFNGGAAKIFGVEAGLTKGYFVKQFYIPVQVNLTYLNARFNSDFVTTAPEWGNGQVNKGDPMPYIPEFQYSLSVGLEYKKFRNELTLSSQSQVFDQSVSENRIKIDAYSVLDFGGSYEVNEKMSLNYKVDNVLAKDYIVAARPFGFRPGKRQAFQMGVRYNF